MIIRLQDKEGRGPWRPGFSKNWITDNNPFIGKPIYEDFPDFTKMVQKAHKEGLHIGCAVQKEKVGIWFTNEELNKLYDLDFQWVNCEKCDILGESDTQVIITSVLPFKFLPLTSY